MLSLDFLAGFTIFLLALIMVVNMVPGLLAGLESSGIDYDAVAYRTGVILAEDPGWWEEDPGWWEEKKGEDEEDEEEEGAESGRSWELRTDKNEIRRMGLAVSRETPNILLSTKIEKFFDETFFDRTDGLDDDYRRKAIFGDILYSYNISLWCDDDLKQVGDPLPEGYGYIRRVVKIKEPGMVEIDLEQMNSGQENDPDNQGDDEESVPPNQQMFTIQINFTYLRNHVTNPAYQIDPRQEPVNVTIEGFNSDHPTLMLKDITFNKTEPGFLPVRYQWLSYSEKKPELYTLQINDNSNDDSYNLTPNVPVTSSVSLVLEPAFTSSFTGPDSILDIQFNFEDTDDPRINSIFLYDYDNVSSSPLKTGVLEVAIW